MRRLLTALFSLCLSAHVACAAITWTPGATVAWQNITFGGNTGTFTNLNGGVNFPAGSFACVSIAGRRNDIAPYASVTIGGVSAAVVVTDQASTYFLSIWCASLAGSTTDSVTVTGNGNFWSFTGVAAGYFTGSATTATATGFGQLTDALSSTQSIQVGGTGALTTITNPASGYGIAAMYGRPGVAATSCAAVTWGTGGSSNITSAGGDVNACSITNPDWISLAHTTTAGSWGPTETSSPANASDGGMVAATFAPASANTSSASELMLGVGQ